MKSKISRYLLASLVVGPTMTYAFVTAPAETAQSNPQPKNQTPAARKEECREPVREKSKPEPRIDLYPQYGGVALARQLDLFFCGKFHLFAYGEFLYWSPVRDQSSIALRNSDLAKSFRKEEFLKYHYRPGFRFGLGIVLPEWDDWVLNAEYTWYHHDFTTNTSASGSSQTLNPTTITTTQLSPFMKMKVKYSLDLDEGKLHVGRPFYLGRRIIAAPFFGLNAAWIGSRLIQNLTRVPADAALQPLKQSANFRVWSVGPAGGIYGSGLLWAGLSIFAKAEVFMMYARITSRTQSISTPFTTLQKQRTQNRSVVFYPAAEGGLGLQWDGYGIRRKCHLNLGISYDVNMYDITDLPFADTIMISAGTFLHGYTVHARLDF